MARSFLTVLTLSAALLSASSPAAPVGDGMPTRTPVATSAFLDGLGVNTHIIYTDGQYADVGRTLEALRFLGVRRVRDSALNPANQGQGAYDVLADAGMRFDMLVLANMDVASTVQRLAAFETRHPGAVAAVEGPNEVNNWPVEHAGLKGVLGAQGFQSALYAKIKAEPRLRDKPVYNLTSWPDIGAAADFANVHSYPKKGEEPYARLLRDLTGQRRVMPGKPMVLTETGSYTLPNGVGWGGVQPDAQARLTVQLLFSAAELGLRQTYLYQLLDAYPDPEAKDQEKHFGLFDLQFQPKPAARAVRNLVHVLAGRHGEQSLPLRPLAVGLSSGSAHVLVLQSGPRAYELAVWREVAIADKGAIKPVGSGPDTVEVRLPGAFDVSAYNVVHGDAAVNGRRVLSRIPLDLSQGPWLITLDRAPAS